jgi:hypothetical protein
MINQELGSCPSEKNTLGTVLGIHCAEVEAQLERQKGFIGLALVRFLFPIPFLFQD